MRTRRHIPNLLTGARLLAVPVCLVMMEWMTAPAQVLFWVFCAASITDFLDGYLARRWQVTSTFGALLDPIADKLLVALMLVYLLVEQGNGVHCCGGSDSPSLSAPPPFFAGFATAALFLPVVVILLRELYISGLREFLAARGMTLPVSRGGKLKTTLQMVGIALLLGGMAFAIPEAGRLGTIAIWLAAMVAFITAIDYTRGSWALLRI